MITAEQLADLALEIDKRDQIDWGELAIDEHTAFKLMAMHVLDMDNCPLTNKAVIVKLLVENFVLNLKLLQNSKNLRL
tara:strand:+ start:311 stop:544 length:234 start_codon:yes stop_codon:yes gene_type:complete